MGERPTPVAAAKPNGGAPGLSSWAQNGTMPHVATKLRVGIVCPYSLSFPGGVQGQVVGIAQALRSLCVDARVLAPCDGPPPAGWVVPLGASVPTAANGSIAPIAPDPAAAVRTIK